MDSPLLQAVLAVVHRPQKKTSQVVSNLLCYPCRAETVARGGEDEEV